jgi:hypothetical protein
MPLFVTYTSLEPSYLPAFSVGGTVPGFSTDSAVSLLASTSFLFTLGIMVCFFVGGLMYMRAGFIRLPASEQAIRKSNAEIKRITLGLIGVASLFVLIYTLNKDLLTGTVGFENLRSGTGTKAPIALPSTKTPTASQPSIPANNDDPKGWNAIKDDPAMRAQLASLPNGGITVSKSVCTNPTQTSCTTVGGWDPGTPTMLAQLRSTCSGGIAVTGGTEAGHKSHGPGLRPVDLSMNQPGGLNDCIKSFPAGPSLGFCYKTYQNFGYVFCDEISVPRHWHVQ